MPETNEQNAEVVARRKVRRTHVMRDAADRGYWLTHRPLEGGNEAWTWLLDDDDASQPSFPTRREAFRFMREARGTVSSRHHVVVERSRDVGVAPFSA